MRYDFYCDECGVIVELRWPMNKELPPMTCEACEDELPYAMPVKMRRLYTAPVLSIPEMNAVDILNRHARGEGDPLPGYTQEQTKWMANEKARQQKEAKGSKSSSLPTRSYPSGGPRPYYGPD